LNTYIVAKGDSDKCDRAYQYISKCRPSSEFQNACLFDNESTRYIVDTQKKSKAFASLNEVMDTEWTSVNSLQYDNDDRKNVFWEVSKKKEKKGETTQMILPLDKEEFLAAVKRYEQVTNKALQILPSKAVKVKSGASVYRNGQITMF